MQNHVKRFVKDESGATAIEYGLMSIGAGHSPLIGVQRGPLLLAA